MIFRNLQAGEPKKLNKADQAGAYHYIAKQVYGVSFKI
jgi:hypothetical protein